MMSFGKHITTMEKREKIIEYEAGKGVVAKYIKSMDKKCEEVEQSLRENMDNDEFFDCDTAEQFIRTWYVIKYQLSAHERNLFCTYLACERDYKKTLEVFNGSNKNYKNVATLKQMMSLVRKKIREKEKQLRK